MKHPHVGRGAADVGDDGVLQPRKGGGPPHAVRGAGSEGEHGVFLGVVGVHQGAVVLADVEGRADSERGQRVSERPDNFKGKLPESRIDDGGVFAFKHADPPDLARHRDPCFGQLSAYDFGRSFLLSRVDLAEDAGDGD